MSYHPVLFFTLDFNLITLLMIHVGLTGGIGSGKSTVAKIFALLGIPVYYADEAARKLMNEDEGIKEMIIRHFGIKAYDNNGLNRSYIAGIVFNDPEKLALLNSLTHPATIRHAGEWMKSQTSPYTIKEAALLFESGSAASLDLIIGVYAPRQLRIARTRLRDGITEEEVVHRMNRQLDEEEKMKRCDRIITNDEQHLLIPQVLALHEEFLSGHSSHRQNRN